MYCMYYFINEIIVDYLNWCQFTLKSLYPKYSLLSQLSTSQESIPTHSNTMMVQSYLLELTIQPNSLSTLSFQGWMNGK